jgi:hypothetical protein
LQECYISSYLGVELTTEEVENIREESNMTRLLCVRLADVGQGLERDVNITLLFDGTGMDFASEGMRAGCFAKYHGQTI